MFRDKESLVNRLYTGAEVRSLPDGTACFVSRGQGESLLLLHGIPLSLLTWRRNLDPLAGKLRVIAPDLKGFGMSRGTRNDYTLEGHAQFLLQLLAELRIRRTSIVGSSFGCAIALTMAMKAPDAVHKLVLINSVGYPSGAHAVERLLRIRLLKSIIGSALRTRMIGKRVFKSRLKRSYADPETMNHGLAEEYFRVFQSASVMETFLATLESFHEEKLAAIIPGISQETLIIWGAHDRVLPAENARWFHHNLSSSRLEILDNCGHLPHEEQAGKVNFSILRFLTGSASACNRQPADNEAQRVVS